MTTQNILPPSISELRALFNGKVIAPDDPRYEEARTPFYGGMDKHPAAIVRAADAGDVSRLVSLAREHGFDLAVRSGGHSNAGYCTCDGGIVLYSALLENPDKHMGRLSASARVLRACADVVEAIKGKPRLNWPELNVALAKLEALKP